MSYILDALRRAEAERERGAIPSLQSQQHTIVEDDAAGPARSHALLWAAAGLAVALVAVLAWSLSGSGAPPARPAVIEGSVAPPASPPAPILLPTTPAAAPMQSAATAAPPVAEPTPAPTAAAKPTVRPQADAKRAADAKRTARRGAEAGRATATSEQETARAAGEPRIYKQIDLPEEIRRELPKLTVGGASYSGDAASRMVMINGQIFHEGDQLGQGLVLERIKLKSAVLSYKGYRYEVTF